jgi:hypothetical protein
MLLRTPVGTPLPRPLSHPPDVRIEVGEVPSRGGMVPVASVLPNRDFLAQQVLPRYFTRYGNAA